MSHSLPANSGARTRRVTPGGERTTRSSSSPSRITSAGLATGSRASIG